MIQILIIVEIIFALFFPYYFAKNYYTDKNVVVIMLFGFVFGMLMSMTIDELFGIGGVMYFPIIGLAISYPFCLKMLLKNYSVDGKNKLSTFLPLILHSILCLLLVSYIVSYAMSHNWPCF